MSIDIVYMRKDLIRPWRAAVEEVAAEKRYLGRVTLPPFDQKRAFPNHMIDNDLPMYGALDEGQLVGWIDIVPVEIPGVPPPGHSGHGPSRLPSRAGTGSRLMSAALAHAPRSGISKVELVVFDSNQRAADLFRKFGFSQIGISRDYRRVDGVTYNGILMERFLS
jgi:GNAT superfamily N-acetyltransferase